MKKPRLLGSHRTKRLRKKRAKHLLAILKRNHLDGLVHHWPRLLADMAITNLELAS